VTIHKQQPYQTKKEATKRRTEQRNKTTETKATNNETKKTAWLHSIAQSQFNTITSRRRDGQNRKRDGQSKRKQSRKIIHEDRYRTICRKSQDR
jgi:hypothetical protein